MKTKKDLHIPFQWEERRPVFLDRLFYLPKQYDHAEKGERVRWTDPCVFGDDRPVFLEFCSGNGQWIGDQARKFPTFNWVAVEMEFARARKIWLKIYREKIPNLYVVCAEGKAFLDYYIAADSISEAFVNFPDPWPKLRHAKHRLIQAPFLQSLSRAVNKKGEITLVTDCPTYRDQMVRECKRSLSWEPLFEMPHYKTQWASYGESFFADLWKKKGLEIFYLRYRNASMD